MPSSIPRTPRLLGLTLFLSLGLCAAAQAANTAGTVAFLQGEVSIRAAQGGLRAAERGATIESGETVETGNAGRVQLRMSDGAYISLQPQTALRLDSYQTAAPGQPESGVMSLLRGGLRTITGLIGRTQRQNYRLTTPTATVGIRGTEFLATADGGTRVRVAGGRVALCTDGGGCLEIGSGQTGFAPSREARPVLVAQAPSLPPAPASDTDPNYLVAEDRTASGDPSVLSSGATVVYQTPLPPGSGTLVPVYAYSSGSTGGGVVGGSVSYGSVGELRSYTDCCSGPSFSSGTVAESGADGVIAWGRWSAGLYGGSPLTAMHYIAGSASAAATVPIVRAYSSFASTAPTLVSTSGVVLATGTTNSVTGSLNVNFTGSTGGTLTYSLSVPIAGQTFSVNGSASQYSTTAFLGASSTITSTGSGCSSTCSGIVPYADAFQGIFTGSGGSRAGGTYAFSTSLGGNVSGAIVFK
jgi:hypothetical protein